MPGLGHKLALWLALAVVVASLGAMAAAMRAAALPDDATGTMIVVFQPGSDEDQIFASLVAAGGAPLRPTWLPFVWVVAGEEPDFVGQIRAAGALGAYGELPFSPQIAGCFAYVDAKAVELFSLGP